MKKQWPSQKKGKNKTRRRKVASRLVLPSVIFHLGLDLILASSRNNENGFFSVHEQRVTTGAVPGWFFPIFFCRFPSDFAEFRFSFNGVDAVFAKVANVEWRPRNNLHFS